MNELTQRGIAAVKAGDRVLARELLGAAVKQTPDDVLAWLWLSGAVESDAERITILRHVLAIDPSNLAAARGLNQVLERQARASGSSAQAPGTPESPAVDALAQQRTPDAGQALAGPPAAAAQPSSAPAEDALAGQAQAAAGLPASERAVPTSFAATDAPPASAAAAPDSLQASAVQAARRRRKEASGDDERIIFRTRPSLVQSLATFWLFFFGALAIGAVLFRIPDIPPGMAFVAALAVWLVFELFVLYVAIRRFRTHYELTGQSISMPFRGRRVKIPIADVLSAECRQSSTQKLLSIGDVAVDAVVAGELAHLRLRDIPDCQKRAEQIAYLARDHGG
jgi:hypothetical protein